EGEEGEGGQGDLQGEEEREPGLVGEEALQEVERVRDGREGQGDAFMNVGVPEAQLDRAQAFPHEAAQGEELERKVAEVEAVAGQETRQEGEEGRAQE